MINDPIVEEIHQIREKLSRQYNYDIQKIFEAVRQKEREHKDRVVNLRDRHIKKQNINVHAFDNLIGVINERENGSDSLL